MKPVRQAALRAVALAWLGLVALALLSLGLAYVRLGAANMAVALTIAAAKGAIVGWWFMNLRVESAVIRLCVAVAATLLVVMFALSGIDVATRIDEPAAVQPPQQIAPMMHRGQ